MPLSPLKCANECNHGCDLHIAPGTGWIIQALNAGWIVQLWKTPPGFSEAHPLPGHNQNDHDHPHDSQGNENHALAYCDAMCAYQGLRKKLMLQSNYARRIYAMEHADMASA